MNDLARMRSAQARWNGTRAGSCCATGVLPWRSGGGGTPAAVLCQQSGLRPNCLSAKGGTGLQGAHRGVAVDGVAAQGSRRRSPGGGRGRRSRRRSLQRLEWGAAGPGKLQKSRRSRCAPRPKILTRHRGTNFCTSSAHFAPSFVRQPNGPECTQIVRNAPKRQFRVQWGGSSASVMKNSNATS